MRFYRKAHRREINYAFENERKAHQQEVKKYRREHKEEYWNLQTQVENQFLRTFRQERIGKVQRDLDRWRNQICNISWMSQKKMKFLQEREDKLLATMRDQDIKDGRRRMENRYLLDAMEIESRRWPKLHDLDNSVATNIILPQTILNYGEYQMKLQRLAFYAEQGDNEAMQKLLDKEDVMQKKNSFLQPLYRDLKSAIKHMTYSEEYKIMREYLMNR